MKALFTSLILMITIPAFNQVKLVVDKIDDFTKEVIKQTVKNFVLMIADSDPFELNTQERQFIRR